MENLFDIKDKVVVITGGTGVLGRTIAEYLAQEGAKVIILGRKEEVGHEMFLNLLSYLIYRSISIYTRIDKASELFKMYL